MYYLLISVSIFQSLEFFFLDKEVQNSRNVICFVVFFFKKKLFSIMQSTNDYKLVFVFPYNSEIAICLNSISRENHEQILVLRNFIHKFGRYAALKILKTDGVPQF